jgi:hypothetical protein
LWLGNGGSFFHPTCPAGRSIYHPATEVELATETEVQPQAEPRVIVQPRSRLGIVLLLTLNAGVIALLAAGGLIGLKLGWFGADQEAGGLTISQLDPATLMTPTGRRLDVKEFGGYVFEVTRIVYGSDPRANSVTITVPGNPPRQGVFRIGDTFAGGQLRVVDITAAAVVLDHQGQQQTFAVEGADLSEIWDRAPRGLQVIPARNKDAIPDLPAGQTRPPQVPVQDPLDEVADDTVEGEDPAPERIPEGTALEDLPIEEPPVLLKREEFRTLVTTLPDIFSGDFVFGQALDPKTFEPDGARILNLRSSSFFFKHGIRAGDDIVALNDAIIYRPADLALNAPALTGADEVRVLVWRGDVKMLFTFVRSAASE